MVDDLVQDAGVVFRLERVLAGDELVGDDAHRVEVGAVIHLHPLGLLRAHVGGGAHGHAGARLLGALGDAGDAEVDDFGRAVLQQQDVGRLDVAVDDAALVGVVESLRHLDQDVEDLGDGELDLGRAEVLQVRPVEELHDDERRALFLVQVVDGHDVGVEELGRGDGLAVEAGAALVVVHVLGRHGLDGHVAAHLGVEALVDHAHGTGADLVDDLVLADFFEDHRCALCLPRAD